MSISVSDQDVCTIITLDGSLTMEDVGRIDQELRPLLEQTKPAVVVNLANVLYIDSSGTGFLVKLLQWARQSNRLLVLAELHPNVEKVFQLSNLNKVFEVAKTVKEALQFIHPRKVFLFDNREDIVFFYQEVVQANHLGFEHGYDIEMAVQACRAGRVNLLLIDALEQEEAKYELVRRLRADEELSKIPIVVLSVYEDEEYQFSQLGVERFTLKPFLVEKFVATLKQFLTPNHHG